jgi:uroporphyrinogen decarboxylase
VPVSLWHHYSEIDQDPLTLAERQIYDNKKYDFDFIKLMPFGLYSVQDWGVQVKFFCLRGQPPVIADYAIHAAQDWDRLQPLPPTYGSYGKALQLAQHVARLSAGAIPFVQTIFSPITTAYKLAGERILLDMRENPALFKQALEVITETTINFVNANIAAGVTGVFFGTQCANRDFMSEQEYEEFGAFYDLQVIDSYKNKVSFDSFHIHGDNIMFDLIEKYPVRCLQWHDRTTYPSLAQARKKTGKCFIGGLSELPGTDRDGHQIPSILNAGTVSEIEAHTREAIAEVNGCGLIIAPGCGADQFVPERNMFAVRRAVGK